MRVKARDIALFSSVVRTSSKDVAFVLSSSSVVVEMRWIEFPCNINLCDVGMILENHETLYLF